MTTTTERREWLGLLAASDGDAIDAAVGDRLASQSFTVLRRPETGLVMARGRIGNTGARFNLAEVTVSRCVVRSTMRTAGVGYAIGHDLAKVELIAKLDALLQVPQWRAVLQHPVLETLRTALAARHARERADAQSSRVRFHELVGP